MVCWQLLRGPVHPIVPLHSPVGIVAGPVISQTIVSLSVQRSWLSIVRGVLLMVVVVMVLVPLLEAQFQWLPPRLLVLLRLGCLIQGLLFM